MKWLGDHKTGLFTVEEEEGGEKPDRYKLLRVRSVTWGLKSFEKFS